MVGTTFKQRAVKTGKKPIGATPSLERQQWLEAAVEALRAKFADAGYVVPQKIRAAIG